MSFNTCGGLRVRDILNLPCLAGSVVVAGQGGLDRVVRHVTVMDAPGGYEWIRGDELVLTSAYFLAKDKDIQTELMPQLSRLGVAAVALKLRRFLDAMPEVMIEHANEYHIPLIELPYSVAWIDVINPVMSEILNSQATILRKSKESHERLLKLVLAGGGLRDIVTELSALIERPVMITDRSWHCMAASPSDPSHEHGRTLASLTPEELQQAWQTGQIVDHAVLPNSRSAHGLYMVPVTVNDKVYAYLVVSQNHEPLSGLNLTIIENACTICALEIMRFKASLEVERRFRSNFIQDLVSGNFASHQVMIRQAESFGWDLSRPHVLLNIDFDGFETYYVEQSHYDDIAIRAVKDRFVQIVESIPTIGNRKLVGADRSDSMIVLLSYDRGVESTYARENALHTAECIRNEVAQRLAPLTVSIGISRVARTLRDIPGAYTQATQAIALGRRVFGPNTCTHFDDLGVFRVICDNPVTDEQRMFHEEWILPILEYDRQRGTDLIHTLKTYFQCNMNVLESAKRLFIHENTLRYRLSKIEQIIGKKLSSGETALNLWIALKLHMAMPSEPSDH
jgi:purine catabolism regulator